MELLTDVFFFCFCVFVSSRVNGQGASKRRGNSSRAMNTDSDAAATADNSDFDYLDFTSKEDYYNGRNGAHRWLIILFKIINKLKLLIHFKHYYVNNLV